MVDGVRGGDANAFTPLYLGFQKNLWRHIRGKFFPDAGYGVDPVALTDEATQEAFKRVLAYLLDGNEVRHFGAYLYRTADNFCLETIDKLKLTKRIRVPIDEDPDQVPGKIAIDESESRRPKNDCSDCITRNLLLIPVEWRLIFAKRLEGSTYPELEKEFGRPAATIRHTFYDRDRPMLLQNCAEPCRAYLETTRIIPIREWYREYEEARVRRMRRDNE